MPNKGRRSETNLGSGWERYVSPFTWRYGSREMRVLFSEVERRAAWRRTWVALAKAEEQMGLLGLDELNGIRSVSGREHIDLSAAHELEQKIGHDLFAELRTFAAQAKEGGGKLHLGATSTDVEDNADIMIYKKAIGMVASRLRDCLQAIRAKVVQYKGTPCMAWTHLQPAEPTTLGYRFASYAQELVLDLRMLESVDAIFLKGKGIKGAVGTSASYRALLGSDRLAEELEGKVMQDLGLEAFPVSGQTYPRKVDYLVLSCLASVAQSCHKFGVDLRVMQSPAFGELSEPMGDIQVGSSAMPFKRNPVLAERMCSLARFVSVLPQVAFANAASSILERTLDDSASRRIAIPEAFLAIDECLTIYLKLVSEMVVHPAMIRRNLEAYGPFSGTEAVLMRLARQGGDRQRLHELIRKKSQMAWDEVLKGRPNPIERLLSEDRAVSSRLAPSEVHALMDPKKYTGLAESRSERFVRDVIDPLLAGGARGRRAAR
ncbi:MAG: adenylosuccinate lyase [Nitrososphaerota archaeon]|nr:adenylosuccinate lyase [Nitrososphaerota archaeon]MDG7026975.1 adenylosuccinate lyase [Nitrososphaerota archaeon]